MSGWRGPRPDEELVYRALLLVWLPDSDSGAPLHKGQEWKAEQKIQWAEVRKEPVKWKSWWWIRPPGQWEV